MLPFRKRRVRLVERRDAIDLNANDCEPQHESPTTEPSGHGSDHYAFGIEPPVSEVAKKLGAKTLLGTGGTGFVQAFEAALANPTATFTWVLPEGDFNFERVKHAQGWYYARDIVHCQYTNWEMLTFRDRPELWPRTRWLKIDHEGAMIETENPLEAELG